MKATIDQDACIGCGLCVDICAVVFKMNADGKAEVKVDTVPQDAEAACKDATEQCPVEAITIE